MTNKQILHKFKDFVVISPKGNITYVKNPVIQEFDYEAHLVFHGTMCLKNEIRNYGEYRILLHKVVRFIKLIDGAFYNN